MLRPLMHLLGYGQSNRIGTNGFDAGGGARSTSPLGGALMFNNGISAWQPNGTYPNWTEAEKRDHLVAMVEQKMGSDAETGMYGTCEAFISLVQQESGPGASSAGYQLLASVGGAGDKNIAQLSTGTPLQRAIDDIHYAVIRANAGQLPAGGPERYDLSAKLFRLGENDQAQQTSPSQFETAYLALGATLDSTAVSEKGAPLTQTAPNIAMQPASHASNGPFNPNIALTILNMGLQNGNNFYMSGPSYQYPYYDSVHLDAYGQYRSGLTDGVALKRILIDGIDWKPLHIASAFRDGPWVELTIAGGGFQKHSGCRLDFDTSTIPSIYGYGFVLRKPDNSLNDIRTVKLLKDKITIRYDNTVSSGSKLLYGIEGPSGVGANGPRGNIRDTQGNWVSVGGYAIHNFLSMQELVLS